MLISSWIRNLWSSLSSQSLVTHSRRKAIRRQSHQTVEALESRKLLTTPTVVSLNLIGATTTDSSTASWKATFSESVTGVDPTDFSLVKTATIGTTLTQVTGSGSTYVVTVSGITGNGTLGLNLVDDDSIQNSTNVPLGGTGVGNGNFSGQVETLDQIDPSVISINRAAPASATTNASSANYTATFSEPVTGVDPTDFSLVKIGTIGTTLTQVTPVSESVYTVTVSGITGNGSLGLNLVDDGSIHDLAGNPLVNSNGTARFADQVTYATGTEPSSMTVADINGDGIPDLIVANTFGHSVGVLLGNGNGTFQPQKTVAAGSYPRTVAVGDVNGDGVPDLCILNESDSTVKVLLGNGNGTFQAPQAFAVGSGPVSVVLSDMNGDGKLDIVVVNLSSDSVSLLLGNGNGTFQPQKTLADGDGAVSVNAGDLNGDGRPDLVLVNESGNSVGVLLGNGNGTFQAQQTFATGTTPISVTIGDVNSDGMPDLIVSNVNDDSISVLLGNGNGTFKAQQTFAGGGLESAVALGDVNGDGKPDIAVTDQNQTVNVLLGNGNGTFQALQRFATESDPEFVSLTDVSGDRKPDLVVLDNLADSVSVLMNTDNGNFTGQVYTLDHVSPFVQSINRTTPASTLTNATSVSFTATFSEPVTGVDPTDFSLVETGTIGTTLTQVTPVSTSVYTVMVSGITGNGALGMNLVDDGSIHDLAGNPLVIPNAASSFANQATYAAGAGPESVTLGDLNGDGNLDLVVANGSVEPNFGVNSVSVLLGNGNGTFQSQQNDATGTQPSSAVVADVNGDGKPDLIVANYHYHTISVLLGNGNGTFQAQQTFAAGSVPFALTVGDINGDGKPDLVVTNIAGGNSVGVFLGNGNGTFQAQQSFATGMEPISVTLGDVNGDGIPDLVVANALGNTMSILLGNGNGTFQAQQTFATGSDPRSVTVADVNGDGKPDIALVNVAGNSVSVFLGNGNGTFQAQQTFATQVQPDAVTVGDVNGDGKPDLVVANEVSDTLGVLLGNGDGTFQTQQTFATGGSPSSVALGDLNGDGRPDLVLGNYNGDSVSVLLANGHGNFTGQVYTLDHVAPTVLSLNVTATPTATSVVYTATFSEAVTGVDSTVFSLDVTGTVGITQAQVAAVSASVYTLTIGGITGVGTLQPNLFDDGKIHDLAGNTLAVPGEGIFTGQVFTVITAPTVTTPTSANVSGTTVTLGGDVTTDGGATLTAVGVLYALTSTNGFPKLGGAGVTKLSGTVATGIFTVNASGLKPGTNYSFVAYATNGAGTTYTSPVSTFTTVANHAPVGTSGTVTALENTAHVLKASDFGFTDPNDSPPNTLLAVKFSILPNAGTLSDNGVPVIANHFVNVTDISAGNLVFTPNIYLTGGPLFLCKFQVEDNGGTANGGVNLDPLAKLLDVNVLRVNHAPIGTSGTVTAGRNTAYALKTSDFGFTDPNDSPTNGLLAVKFSLLPNAGTLQDNGVDVTLNQFVSAADISAGKLVFTPNANLPIGQFFLGKFQVEDNGGTANGGANLDPTPKTLDVNLVKVNQAPVGTSGTVTVIENTAYALKTSDFGFTDPNDTPANTLLAVKFSLLPTAGTFTDNGVPVIVNQFVSASDISAGRLAFTPNTNLAGSSLFLCKFQVEDNGGTANGGVNLDPNAKVLDVNLVQGNHAPVGTSGTVSGIEDASYTLKATDFGFTDPNDTPANTLLAVKFALLPTAGTLMDNGTAVTLNQFVNVSDISSDKLAFIPNTNLKGGPFFLCKFQVQDNGGTANGGVNLDPNPKTLDIRLTPAT